MSGVSLPVTRPIGRALIVGHPSARSHPVATLRSLGYDCAEADDPYTAMVELCRRRQAYHALILSLASLYREELNLIATVKRRFPHLEVWLAHTDGRNAFLAEALRYGADGLLSDDGLHRIATPAPVSNEALVTHHEPDTAQRPIPIESVAGESSDEEDDATSVWEPHSDEPLLTADELRALLQDQPYPPAAER